MIYPNESLLNRQSSIDDYKKNLNVNKRKSVQIKKNSDTLFYKNKIKKEIFIDSNDNQDIDNNDLFWNILNIILIKIHFF